MSALTATQRAVVQQQVRDYLTMLRGLESGVVAGDRRALELRGMILTRLEALALEAVFADQFINDTEQG